MYILHSVRNVMLYEGKVKSSSLAYNRRETRDKRPLDPDRSWCHLHTSVTLLIGGKNSRMRMKVQYCLMQARLIEIHQVFRKK